MRVFEMMRGSMNMIKACRWMVPAIALVVLVIPCAAYPALTGSGISQSASASWDSIIGPKNTWSSAEGSQWMMGWIKIVPGSELDTGAERYKYKYDIAAAGSPQSGLLYGPFPFYQGDAKMSRQVDSLFLSYGPGSWEVRFYITDTQGGADTLITALPFTLQGGTQTTATTVPTTTATTVPATQVQFTYTTSATTPVTATTTVTQTPLITTPVPVGSIAVTSVPTGAMVYIDDGERGITPITLYSVPVGMHSVRVHTKGYTDNQTQVSVVDQKTTLLDISLFPTGVQPSPVVTTPPTTVPTTVEASSEALKAPGLAAPGLIMKLNEGKPMEREKGSIKDGYSVEIPVWLYGLPNDHLSRSVLREIDFALYYNSSMLRPPPTTSYSTYSYGVWLPNVPTTVVNVTHTTKDSRTGIVHVKISTPDALLYHEGVYLWISFEPVGAVGDSGQVTCEVLKAYDRDGNLRTAGCEGTTVTIIPQKPRKSGFEPVIGIIAIVAVVLIWAGKRKY